MRKKTDVWIDRGELVKEDNTTIQTESSFNILQVHQKLSIENFFNVDTTEVLGLAEINEILTDEHWFELVFFRKQIPESISSSTLQRYFIFRLFSFENCKGFVGTVRRTPPYVPGNTS